MADTSDWRVTSIDKTDEKGNPISTQRSKEFEPKTEEELKADALSYEQIYGKPLYRDREVIIDVKKKVKDITEFKPLLNQPTLINTSNFIITSNIINSNIPASSSDTNEKILWISKTDDADIYYLYDNFNILTANKIGIALVPTIKDSIKLRNEFKDKNLTFTIKYRCIFNEKFNKFQPVEKLV